MNRDNTISLDTLVDWFGDEIFVIKDDNYYFIATNPDGEQEVYDKGNVEDLKQGKLTIELPNYLIEDKFSKLVEILDIELIESIVEYNMFEYADFLTAEYPRLESDGKHSKQDLEEIKSVIDDFEKLTNAFKNETITPVDDKVLSSYNIDTWIENDKQYVMGLIDAFEKQDIERE